MLIFFLLLGPCSGFGVERDKETNCRLLALSPALLKAAVDKGSFVQVLQLMSCNTQAKENPGNNKTFAEISPRVVSILLENGADVDYRDTSGSTALIWAAKNNRTDIVSTLLGKGSINTKSSLL